MASAQIDDQTDEDFFDRLVDDEFDGSSSKPEDLTRVLSNLSLGDVGASLDVSREAEFGGRVENSEKGGGLDLHDAAKEGVLDSNESLLLEALDSNESLQMESSNSVESAGKKDGSKGTSVKVVQWSSFSVDNSEEFEKVTEFEPYSDFLSENPEGVGEQTGSIDNPVENFSSNVGSTEQQDAQNDPQYWENLYPGWKFDASTGQWYQVDSYEATNNSILDNSNVGDSELVSDTTGVSYLQQTSQSAVETVAENCTVGSVSNWITGTGSQQSVEYPPNMVFDPQYPEWYYDTNTQQWCSLESYTQSIQSSSNAVQDQLAFSSEQNHGFYSNVKPSEQRTVQSNSSQVYAQMGNYSNQNSLFNASYSPQDFGQTWDASKSNYDRTTSFYNKTNQPEQNNQRWGSQEFGQDWGKSTSNHSRKDSILSNISQSTHTSQDFGQNWDSSTSNYAPQNSLYSNTSQSEQYQSQYAQNNMWQPQKESWTSQQPGFKPFEPVVKQNFGDSNGVTGFQSFAPKESTYQINQPKVEQTLEAHLSNSYYGEQNTVNYSQQSFSGPNGSFSQFSYAPSEGRSSAGRPPHALVAFGFGGKLIVMKDVNSFGANLDYGKQQENSGGGIFVLSLSEIVKGKGDASGFISGSNDGYFSALCQQSFPGPLVGGSAATKDVNKWIDERITACESASVEVRKEEFFKLLFSMLKIMCQHYGKLRAPFGVDPSAEEIDGPESAVARLFASARKNGVRLTEFGSLAHSIQNLPLEGQLRATTIEVQNLLVSGRRKAALQRAQEGQLWGPALVLAAQLGEKFYVDTVKNMAQRQFVYGSPLRTLCLLIAGQPADIFSGAANGPHGSTEVLSNGILDEWEENLAIITANRTKDDELVIVHLGDCLLKERNEIIAAHTCYLVAETNFESYSDSARLCLIGADHWKCPRTYASPEAIQRTEVYEYSKVLGNSQFVLQPFQAYKLVYAYMLAEVGNVSDSLRYCQASLKLMKSSSRTSTPEVEMLKTMLSSLEERLRIHLQGGYGSNSNPAKLVGKLITSIDRSIHRMMGAPPASLPPLPHSSTNNKEVFSMPPKVASSQSTVAMSSLVPSASVEAISEWTGDGSRKAIHNRSISEPDFGRTPKQDAGSPDGHSKHSGAPSRFGRIGSQLLQKTMGWVSRPRSDRQAKLGETNKFYYNEKLKMWLEEGAEPPAEESALPPPPTTAVFQNGISDYNIISAFKNPSPASSGGPPETKSPVPLEPNSGIPPIPPSQNQFSARARMGVRSRYVDTFNKGSGGGGGSGTLTNSFQSPSAPSVKPAVGAKFFVPTIPAPSDEPKSDAIGETTQDSTIIAESTPLVSKEASSSLPSASPPSSSSSTLHRFPSLDMSPLGNKVASSPQSNNDANVSHTRSSSWGGSSTDVNNLKASGFMAGSPPHFFPQNAPPTRGFLGDELHEVEL